MKLLKDINKVFDICNLHTNENLKENYMYMYSNNESNTHHFKHIETREYIKIGVTI